MKISIFLVENPRARAFMIGNLDSIMIINISYGQQNCSLLKIYVSILTQNVTRVEWVNYHLSIELAQVHIMGVGLEQLFVCPENVLEIEGIESTHVGFKKHER